MIGQAFGQVRKASASSADTAVSVSKKRKADASPDGKKPNSFSKAMSTMLLGLPNSDPKLLPPEEETTGFTDDIGWAEDSDDGESHTGPSKGTGYAGVTREDVSTRFGGRAPT